MAINILMPALSPTMEEGKLSKWLKREGDAVKPGDVIAEIETDKATMEVEAIDEGTLARILVPEGTENVKVNTPIAILGVEGEDDVGEGAARRRRGASGRANLRRRRPSRLREVRDARRSGSGACRAPGRG